MQKTSQLISGNSQSWMTVEFFAEFTNHGHKTTCDFRHELDMELQMKSLKTVSWVMVRKFAEKEDEVKNFFFSIIHTPL